MRCLPGERVLRDAVIDRLRESGMEVITDEEAGQRVLDEANGKAKLSAKKRRALETASLGKTPRSLTVVSSADGANVLKSIDTLVSEFEKSAVQPKTFIGDVAKALGAERGGSASEYASFETKNGKIITIRLSNHNAKVSNFDANGETDGISIVVSPKKSGGMTNDGKAHVVEYYYDAIKLRRAEGKPLADIVRSIKQALYSGEFEDTTGLAERQEVNAEITDKVRFFRAENGEAYGFTVGGKIYIDPGIANAETPVHEYAHLWASALRAGNAKEWENVVGLMKGTAVWDEVRRRYPELETDDDIADEVLAHYSGRRGAERLRGEARRISGGNGGVFEKAEAISALQRVREALRRFWKGVADFLHIHYTSAEEVADRVMKDLLDGVDPGKFGKGGARSEAGLTAAMEARVMEIAEKLHLGKVNVVTDVSGLEGRRRGAKGWYDRRDGTVTVVLPNHSDVADAEATMLHEAVAHKGLRALFGERFDEFLRNVYGSADKGVRSRIDALAAKYNGDTGVATEEYLAGLAERTEFGNAARGFWERVRHWFAEMLRKSGIPVRVTDNELRYELWRSYSNLKDGRCPRAQGLPRERC